MGSVRRSRWVTKSRWRPFLATAALMAVGLAALAVRPVGQLAFSEVSLRAAAADGPLQPYLARWWLRQHADDLLPPSNDGRSVIFRVEAGEDLTMISERLAALGLVRDGQVFRQYARLQGLDRKIRAGATQLRRNMTAQEVLTALLHGQAPTVTVTLLEGWRAEEIAERLASARVCDAQAFLRLVRTGTAFSSPIGDRPAGAGLEGYLFPDTYDFAPGTEPDAVLRRLLTTFESKAGPMLLQASQETGLTTFEALTLASIVEREATLANERPRIARVYLNRLATPPHLLNADPTVQYALGYQEDSGRWWKASLTPQDLAIPSPYNTYLVPGLPPGPIANPGLASIVAVAQPEAGDWQYFVLDGDRCDGSHLFAVTWEEHLANVERYRRSGCGR